MSSYIFWRAAASKTGTTYIEAYQEWSLFGPSCTALMLLSSWRLSCLSLVQRYEHKPSATPTSMLTSGNQDAHGKSHAIVALTHCQVSNSMGLTLVWHSHSIVNSLSLIHTCIHTHTHTIYIVDT